MTGEEDDCVKLTSYPGVVRGQVVKWDINNLIYFYISHTFIFKTNLISEHSQSQSKNMTFSLNNELLANVH